MSKVWLITGAGRGLGRSITEAALADGAQVVATARNVEQLKDLKQRYPETLRCFSLDVTDEAKAQAAVAFTVEAFGHLDVLVNNAGYGHVVPFEQMTADDFRGQIDTNLYGVVNLTRAALPVMRRQKAGRIINIASVGARIGTPGLSAYQAAKWAVAGFTEVLAQEVAPFGVKVVSVEPGGIRTGWGETARGSVLPLLPDYEASVGTMLGLLQEHVGHEVGDPDKMAKVIVDLARRDDLPMHLLLGSDALFFFDRVDAARAEAAKAWEPVTRSTDFEGTDLSALAGLLDDA